MAITVNIYYTGKNGNARKFAGEMVSRGIVRAIREEAGNLRYEYFFPMNENEKEDGSDGGNKSDGDTLLLIDSWTDQRALDLHHATPMMKEIAELREKYDLHMKVERYISDDDQNQERDKTFIRE